MRLNRKRSTQRKSWLRTRLLKRFARDTKGVAAIEMALVAAPFIAVILAILESGLVYFSEFALEKKVAEASRLIRTGQVTDSNTALAGFKDTICDEISPLFDCSKIVVDVRSFTDFQAVNETGLPDPTDGSDNLVALNGWDTGGESDVVVVRVFYEWDLILPGGITQMDNLRAGTRFMSASASFRNEPFNAIQFNP
ncbi:MAG: TadE/TadG family type IV pilus assembly protein [Hyphomicrobiales bacterium]